MKSPGNIFAVALMQILLVVLLFPFLILLFLFSLVWRKFDWKSVLKWLESFKADLATKPVAKQKRSEASTDETYDVQFEPKKDK